MKNFLRLCIVALIISCGEDVENVPSPELTRYVDSVFTEIDIKTNIQYGRNNSLSGIPKNLLLDVYVPVGDELTERPTIVLAHGGAFVTGSKSDLAELCSAYALMGYTAVSVGYNLIDDRFLSDSVRLAEAVVIAIGDMRGAIRFLRNEALNGENEYGINPDLIFAGGVSAGAIMANHVGLWDEDDTPIPEYIQNHVDANGGFEGDSNELNVSSEVSGIISFSGSIIRSAWIDSSDPQIFMVHEENDPIVPCGYESTDIFPFDVLAYGSCEIENAAIEAGLGYEFTFYENEDTHVSYFGDERAETLIKASAVFMNKIIVP